MIVCHPVISLKIWHSLNGGMIDGRFIQQLNPLTVPSKRRNPLLADFFNRLGLMERRGSGMKKIIDSYKRFERLPNYHIPEFQSNASEFHVVLWNLNYGSDSVIDEKRVPERGYRNGKRVPKSAAADLQNDFYESGNHDCRNGCKYRSF